MQISGPDAAWPWLIDHARRRGARKRDGGVRVSLDATAIFDERAPTPTDVLAVDEALVRLARLDARQARIVEMRFFAGMTADEIAHELHLSRRTVQGDWNMARPQHDAAERGESTS